ncbi:MAG: hypothetical protein F7B59_04335 [Desulfurococcales archaeon]|nr:hypothetical protein [Desulfurococcales archaeon]
MLEEDGYIRLLGLGRCLPEALPFYHYCLYSTCLRITPLHSRTLPFECNTCSIGQLNFPPDVAFPARVNIVKIRGLINGWKPCCVFLDGIEPLENINIDTVEALGIPLSARTQGYSEIPGNIEAIVFDVFPGMYNGVGGVKVLETLSNIAQSGLHVEVVFYLNQLRAAPIAPYLQSLPSSTIIHLDYQGVASLSKAEKLRESLKERGYNYIYLRDSERWIWDDTECHQCGNRIVSRRNSIAIGHHVTSNCKCGYCGVQLPFKRVSMLEDNVRRIMSKKSILTEWLDIYALTN